MRANSGSAAGAFTTPPQPTRPVRSGRGVQLERIACLTCAAVACGKRENSRAATPLNMGAAIDPVGDQEPPPGEGRLGPLAADGDLEVGAEFEKNESRSK